MISKTEIDRRRRAFQRGNAIVKLEGWQPSRRILSLQEDIINGRKTVAEVEAIIIAEAKSVGFRAKF